MLLDWPPSTELTLEPSLCWELELTRTSAACVDGLLGSVAQRAPGGHWYLDRGPQFKKSRILSNHGDLPQGERAWEHVSPSEDLSGKVPHPQPAQSYFVESEDLMLKWTVGSILLPCGS